MGRRFILAIVMGLLLTVLGCATSGPTQHSALAPSAPNADEGFIVLKVIGVQPLSVFNAKWGTLKLVEKASGRNAELRDTAPSEASYSLFVGTLPAGQYDITGFHTDGMAPGSVGVVPSLVFMAMTSDSRALDAQLGSFSVRAGALSNLGIVVSALPEDDKSPFRVAVLSDQMALSATLADVEPVSRARLAALPVTSWDRPPATDAAAHALEIVRTQARNVSAMEVLDDGRLVIGSALGMLHLRSTDGRWSSMSTGSLDSISYVRALPGGRLFAATDNGRYHLWIPEQKVWRSQALQLGERIVQLEPVGNAGWAMLTQPSRSNLPPTYRNRILWKTDLETSEAPRLLLSLDGFSAMGQLPLFYDGQELLVTFNHVGFSRTADMYHINPVTGKLHVEKLDHWVASMYRLLDGGLARERINGTSIYTDFSVDQGRTWLRSDNAGPHTLRFIDRERGWGLATSSTGWSTVALVLNKTSTGGRQWDKLGATFEAAGGRFSLRVIGDTVLVFTGKQLLSTKTDGATWTVEWPRSPAL